MTSEISGLLIVPISLAVSGVIFLCIAYYLKYRYGYRGGIKATGILVGFRKLDNDHYAGAMASAMGHGKYTDFNTNVTNSKPVIRFLAAGREVECHSEWSAADLSRSDIGKEFPIRYFPAGGNSYRVILEGRQYEQQRGRGQKIIFWIFVGVGIALIAMAILAVALYRTAVK